MTDYQTPSAKENILPETEPIADESAFSDMPESLPDADAAEEQGEEDAPLPEEEIDYEKIQDTVFIRTYDLNASLRLR